MENWRNRIFLMFDNGLATAKYGLACAVLVVGTPLAAAAQEVESRSDSAATPPPIIDPRVERRSVTYADIDSENFEVTAFAGFQSIEDFGNDATVGLRLGYHVTENWFVEAAYASSTAGTTSFEDLSGGVQFLTDDEREFEVYDLSVGYNLNGEIFFSEGVAFNTDFYLMLGGGSTDFGGDERFTVTLGAGYRLLLTDYMALRVDVRDYMFNSDLIGEEKSTHNMAYTLGVSLFF